MNNVELILTFEVGNSYVQQTVKLENHYCAKQKQINYFFIIFFQLLSVLLDHSVFSSPPQRPMTSDFEGFSIPDFIHYIYYPS